jgi:primase-polymerase (primpol)-like protein
MVAAGTGSNARSKAAFESDSNHRPKPLAVNPAGIPRCLQERPQWVAWRYQWRDGWTKIPIDPKTGHNAEANEPATWGTFEQALDYHRANPTTTAGIGYEFSADDPYCGIDLDDAIDQATGEVYPWARPVVAVLATCTETSPSGTGVKLICEAAKPDERCKTTHNGHKIEVYEHGRFFALTGQRPRWYPAGVEARHEELEYGYNRVFGDGESPLVLKVRGGRDEDLIWQAAEAANGDKFLRLWLGDTSLHHGDDSSADLALCSLLAFWCGRNSAERIDRLFRRSGLMRGKWDEKRGKQTYGAITIAKALKDRTEFYGEGHHEHNGHAPGQEARGGRGRAETKERARPLTVPPGPG